MAINAPDSLFSSQVCSEVSAESLINPKLQPQGHDGPIDMKPFKSALWRCRRDNSKTTRIIEPPETANVCSVQPLLPNEPKLFSFLFLFNFFSWFSVFPEITLSFFHKPSIHTVI